MRMRYSNREGTDLLANRINGILTRYAYELEKGRDPPTDTGTGTPYSDHIRIHTSPSTCTGMDRHVGKQLLPGIHMTVPVWLQKCYEQ